MADSGPSHHALEIGEVAAQLAVDITCGLSTAEAAERQHKFGLNRITVKFVQQFNQPLVYILLAAGCSCGR